MMASPTRKTLLLGTALWGWGTDRNQARDMLEGFLARGGIWVDTAVNYPINKHPEDRGLACEWLADWSEKHPDSPLKVLIKLGAKDNGGNPETDLSPDNLEALAASYRRRFGEALGALAIHWDNRGGNPGDEAAIAETLEVMSRFHAQGLVIGFSGVRHPECYRALAPQLADHWWIQVKENLQTRHAFHAYQPHFPKARYLAYGINLGGLKSSTSQASGTTSSLALRGLRLQQDLAERLDAFLGGEHGITPAPRDFNHLALLLGFVNPHLGGLILGPRNRGQLDASLDYWESLEAGLTQEHDALYARLHELGA